MAHWTDKGLPARRIDDEWYVPVGDLHTALDALEGLYVASQPWLGRNELEAQTLREARGVLRHNNRLQSAQERMEQFLREDR